MVIRAASSLERSLIRSAARRSRPTRSFQGVAAQAGKAARAAATASSTSRSLAECTTASSRLASLGLPRVKVSPSVRGWPSTTTGMVWPAQDLAVLTPSS
jgi:hypothetical protein